MKRFYFSFRANLAMKSIPWYKNHGWWINVECKTGFYSYFLLVLPYWYIQCISTYCNYNLSPNIPKKKQNKIYKLDETSWRFVEIIP